jgi:hypothetical protein
VLLSRRLNLRFPPPPSLPGFPSPYRFPCRSVFSLTPFFPASSRLVPFPVPNRLRSIPFCSNQFRARTEKHREGVGTRNLPLSSRNICVCDRSSANPNHSRTYGPVTGKPNYSRTYAVPPGGGGSKPKPQPSSNTLGLSAHSVNVGAPTFLECGGSSPLLRLEQLCHTITWENQRTPRNRDQGSRTPKLAPVNRCVYHYFTYLGRRADIPERRRRQQRCERGENANPEIHPADPAGWSGVGVPGGGCSVR